MMAGRRRWRKRPFASRNRGKQQNSPCRVQVNSSLAIPSKGCQPRWEDLDKDLLAYIFGKLTTTDLIAGASLVCTSWRNASSSPTLWRTLDFSDWRSSISPRLGRRGKPYVAFTRLLIFALSRNGGSIEAIRFPSFAGEVDLLFVADRCPRLSYFYIEDANISHNKFCEAVGRLPSLHGMAVHDNLICEEVIKQVAGCTHFCELKIIGELVDINMALVICRALPRLKKLELNNCNISRKALHCFLDKLKDLEYLDISGYESVGITQAVLDKAAHLKVFIWDCEFEEDRLRSFFEHD